MNKTYFFIVLLISIFLSLVHPQDILAKHKNHAKRPTIHKEIDRNFVDNVFSEICSHQILFPEIVMRQAILETSWFKSHYLISRNNLFAFRKFKYLKFASWQRSVEYYKEWQLKNYRPTDPNYYDFLVRIKYADTGYIDELKLIKWDKHCN